MLARDARYARPSRAPLLFLWYEGRYEMKFTGKIELFGTKGRTQAFVPSARQQRDVGALRRWGVGAWGTATQLQKDAQLSIRHRSVDS